MPALRVSLHRLLAASAALPLALAAARAQESPPAAAPTPAAAKTAPAPAKAAPAATEVGEIVVTATRQAQSLSKVPESVSAFTGEAMQVRGIKDFAEVAYFTPGVTFNETSNNISIRGISSTAGSGTTGIYIDDTPIQVRNLGLNSNNSLPSVFDLERVEVLRGPQGTLFGAGSEGGTVRYITTQPSLTHFSADGHAEVAFTDGGTPTYEIGAATGGPIVGDKLGFRVSAWGRHEGGYIDRVDYQTLAVTQADANWVDVYTLRGALTWAPIPQLTITPGIFYQQRNVNNYDNYWVSISNPGAGLFRNGTPDTQPDADHFYLPTLRIEYDNPSFKIISNTAYYDRSEKVGGYSGTLYNLSYFQQYLTPADSNPQFGYPSDPQGTPCSNNCQTHFPLLTPTGPNLPGMPNYIAWNRTYNAQQNFTQELRIQSANPDARLTWTAGVFYAYNKQQSTETIIDPMLPALTQYLWAEDMDTAWGMGLLPGDLSYINATQARDQQLALFGEGNFLITSNLKLTVGLRWAWANFSFTNQNNGAQDLLDNGGVAATASGGSTEYPFTPKAILSYQATPDDLWYVSVSKGYRIGGASPPLPAQACGGDFPTQYGSDHVWSYEIGTKDRFLDRKLQISASAFYIQWSNIQQAVYVPTCGIQYTTNAGSAVSQGFDAEVQYTPTPGLTLGATVGYTDAKFTSFALIDNTLPATPDNVLVRPGNSLDVVPWTITLSAEYNFKIHDLPMFVRVDDVINTFNTGTLPSQDRGTAFYDPGLVNNPATNLTNLRVGLTLGHADLQVYVENVFNATPRLNLTHQDEFTTLFEASTFRPRTIGLSANYHY